MDITLFGKVTILAKRYPDDGNVKDKISTHLVTEMAWRRNFLYGNVAIDSLAQGTSGIAIGNLEYVGKRAMQTIAA